MAAGEHVEPAETEWRDFAGRFGLSRRQLQIAKLIFADCPSKLLAQRLGCARSTAASHRAALYAKLQVVDHTLSCEKSWSFASPCGAAEGYPPH